MQNKKLKIINYAGTKINFIDLINPEINKSNKTIYIEPFLGSGSVFFNLEKEFDTYILNDKDRNVVRIFNSFKNGTYQQYLYCQSQILESFGDIKKDKEAFYNFRNSFNSTHWMKNTIKEGFFLFILYNSCINSLSRFGPSGFNQSYGNRTVVKTFNEDVFNSINYKLKNALIWNFDFNDLLKAISPKNLKNSLIFLDPPYIKRPAGYKTITDEFYISFIEFVKTSESDILYTDIKHDDLDMDYILLRESMQNISPNRKEEYTKIENITIQEVMYKNY